MTRRCLLVLLTLVAIGCDSPVDPDPPPGDPPILACPASQSVPSPLGAAVAVTYAAPTVTGGTSPVTGPKCAPPSGTPFAVGSTTVNCATTDADARAATCAFTVTVVPPPTLTKTRFLAFGDSITAGTLSNCPGGIRPLSLLDDTLRLRAAVNVPTSYPTQLQTLLRNRYTMQLPTVVNEGVPGEPAGETMFTGEGSVTGSDRLPGVLSSENPEALLLMEGINDVHQGATTSNLVTTLRSMVQEARGRGIHVFLGTLLPQRIGACRNFAEASHILAVNDGIRSVAASEGATLVDFYQAIIGNEATLLGPDGLHPNVVGYEQMAQKAFTAIRSTLEAAPPGIKVQLR